jgi:hypothetical protein
VTAYWQPQVIWPPAAPSKQIVRFPPQTELLFAENCV